ncbi:hypothetical protein JET18_18780 [Chryseobacterium sp. L7]|uniref:Lipoprotein n=1 Tax=Chryseobacterium endalhagicum TaxID=2797638 RepID=A0ABS1QJX0_9FLAO|nr:hypothetical protein [Chryseobacterium endalhagicum]MBL1222908.1 hypothetical protein [Chryseobacterium endalhagicum]
MKKISFLCISLLIFTACKNDSKTTTETLTAEKDTAEAKAIAVENKTASEKKEIPALKKCTEKQIEYETEQECIFSNAHIADVYKTTIQDQEIEKSELLLTELPKENITKEINQDGLISISYTVTPKKTDIEFSFEGGVTTLSLEQQNKDVKRLIIHSAD